MNPTRDQAWALVQESTRSETLRRHMRSVEAAMALEQAGFADVINVLHGFEGDLDEQFHRSSLNGWRHDGLPWEQL